MLDESVTELILESVDEKSVLDVMSVESVLLGKVVAEVSVEYVSEVTESVLKESVVDSVV